MFHKTHECSAFFFGYSLVLLYTPILLNISAPPVHPECDTTLESGDFLEEGDTITMTCMSKADSQDATLVWYNGTTPLSTHHHQSNDTKIDVKVTEYDDGRQLFCKAENNASRFLEITPTCSINLTVFCKYSDTDGVCGCHN